MIIGFFLKTELVNGTIKRSCSNKSENDNTAVSNFCTSSGCNNEDYVTSCKNDKDIDENCDEISNYCLVKLKLFYKIILI